MAPSKIALCVLAGLMAVSIQARNVSVLETGAVSDGKTLCTAQIQKAIDLCSESGGGQVVFPQGTFLTGTIYLKDHVELYLERGSRILGSLEIPGDYPKRALVYAEKVNDIGIAGPGTIDGQSDHPSYKERFRVNDGKRPRGVEFSFCNNVSVKDVTIRNAGSWTLHLVGCDGVDIDGITIYCLTQGNNDGIDCEARNVRIANCKISCDDDGICLKNDLRGFVTENVTVTNCIVASNCNAIKLGTSSLTGYRNITVSNCVVRPTEESVIWDWPAEYRGIPKGTNTGLAGIAVESVDGGHIENVTFDNIVMEGIITPIFVCLGSRKGNGSIRNIRFTGITAKANGVIPCLISGTPDLRIDGVVLRDIVVEHEGGEDLMEERLPENEKGYPENRMYGHRNPAGGLFIRHADNVRIDNFQVVQRNLDHRPAIFLDDVKDARIRDVKSTGSDYPAAASRGRNGGPGGAPAMGGPFAQRPFLMVDSEDVRFER